MTIESLSHGIPGLQDILKKLQIRTGPQPGIDNQLAESIGAYAEGLIQRRVKRINRYRAFFTHATQEDAAQAFQNVFNSARSKDIDVKVEKRIAANRKLEESTAGLVLHILEDQSERRFDDRLVQSEASQEDLYTIARWLSRGVQDREIPDDVLYAVFQTTQIVLYLKRDERTRQRIFQYKQEDFSEKMTADLIQKINPYLPEDARLTVLPFEEEKEQKKEEQEADKNPPVSQPRPQLKQEQDVKTPFSDEEIDNRVELSGPLSWAQNSTRVQFDQKPPILIPSIPDSAIDIHHLTRKEEVVLQKTFGFRSREKMSERLAFFALLENVDEKEKVLHWLIRPTSINHVFRQGWGFIHKIADQEQVDESFAQALFLDLQHPHNRVRTFVADAYCQHACIPKSEALSAESPHYYVIKASEQLLYLKVISQLQREIRKNIFARRRKFLEVQQSMLNKWGLERIAGQKDNSDIELALDYFRKLRDELPVDRHLPIEAKELNASIIGDRKVAQAMTDLFILPPVFNISPDVCFDHRWMQKDNLQDIIVALFVEYWSQRAINNKAWRNRMPEEKADILGHMMPYKRTTDKITGESVITFNWFAYDGRTMHIKLDKTQMRIPIRYEGPREGAGFGKPVTFRLNYQDRLVFEIPGIERRKRTDKKPA